MVIDATSSIVMPFIIAILSAIKGIYFGSLGFPLKGCGVKKGASVSSSILLRGISLTTLPNSKAFLSNYSSNTKIKSCSKHHFAICTSPEKQ